MSRLSTFVMVIAGLVANMVVAEEMTSQGSHVHGEAQLTFVLDGNEAELALVTAVGNIVGFEHQPANDAEKLQHKTQLDMIQSARWFTPDPAANCTVSGQEQRIEADNDGHADVYVNIQLLCQAPLKLNAMTFSLFELAPALEQLKVQYLVDGAAGAVTLDKTQPALPLR